MTSEPRSDYVTREAILNLLSDEEVARVSHAETAARLTCGDQYLDLDALENGVRTNAGASEAVDSVVPRNGVHEATWKKIVSLLQKTPARPKQ